MEGIGVSVKEILISFRSLFEGSNLLAVHSRFCCIILQSVMEWSLLTKDKNKGFIHLGSSECF